MNKIYYRFAKENCKNNRTFVILAGQGLKSYKFEKSNKLECRGFEPLTPTLPVSCAPSCANAP